MIPRLPGPWHPGPYPYEVFAGTSLTPAASHATILRGSGELQQLGRMTLSDRVAFDRLRIPAERLAVDFFLFNPDLTDPESLAEAALQELAHLLYKGARS
ncbi:MAG: hypothetical protein U0840_11115 [Gemmataceae bacterium]